MPKYTKRKDGRYQTRIYMGTDSNHKKQYKFLYATTEKELQRLEMELRVKQTKGVDLVTYDDTFSQWLNRLLTVKETELAESEYNTFKARTKVFEERVGNLPLKSISQSMLQPIVNEIYARNSSTGKPSVKRTVARYISAASAVFSYAIECRSADFNPCVYLKVPKAAKTTERRMLTPTERQWVEDTPHRAQLPAMLMMYSGLRKGEVTALTWADIDFDNHTISVNKSFNFKQGEIKLPKTTAGNRVVSVPAKLIRFLQTIPKNNILVVTTANGDRMTESAWKRLWENYLKDLDLKYGTSLIKRSKFDPKGSIMTIEPFTPHCLRHTFCSIMYEAGTDVLTAKDQMGHSDIKTTLSIYTHLDKQHKQKNISKLDAYLDGNAGSGTGT